MMTIHFNADLRPIVGERVGMLHWVMDPEVSGFVIGYDLSDNQVLICNFDASVIYWTTDSQLTGRLAREKSFTILERDTLPEDYHRCNR